MKYTRIEAPQPEHNLFPLCACVRLCLTCASGCIGQCAAEDNGLRCQQQREHDGEHYAEGLTDGNFWTRATWAGVVAGAGETNDTKAQGAK